MLGLTATPPYRSIVTNSPDAHLWELLAAHDLCEAVQSLRVKLGSVVCLSQVDGGCISQV